MKTPYTQIIKNNMKKARTETLSELNHTRFNQALETPLLESKIDRPFFNGK